MARIRPFSAIRYARPAGSDISDLVAPPFDVLDAAGKAALQARSPHNIVTVDLPYLPPKAVGPDAVYQQAAATLDSWLASGVLKRDRRAALYPYEQTFDYAGRTFRRRGFFALVRATPFGKGPVIPHEKTYRGAIEDRLRLMRFTRMQLSPIFGLYDDPHNRVANALYHNVGRPLATATLEGVRHTLWSVADGEVENQIIDILGTNNIYIADGHHRYTTALEYRNELQQQAGKPLPDPHPANWVLFALVGMQDPGLLMLPTHRLIGGLDGFEIDAFKAALGANFQVSPCEIGPDRLSEYADEILPKRPAHTFGLFDGRTRTLHEFRLLYLDILKDLEPGHSETWRQLDVAILHRYVLDEVIRPRFAGGRDPLLGYTADKDALAAQADGRRYQIALLLQPTPLLSLEQLARHNEVMPQKSTYFFPKLATGMVLNSVRDA